MAKNGVFTPSSGSAQTRHQLVEMAYGKADVELINQSAVLQRATRSSMRPCDARLDSFQ
jgi:hypothetical protein